VTPGVEVWREAQAVEHVGGVALEGTGQDLIGLARARLQDIERCMVTTIGRLSPEDLAWRPNGASNSVINLTLHVCGNLRQRFHAGFGGAEDDRDREAEFAEASARWTGAELTAMVREAFGLLDDFLGALTPERLGETRLIPWGRTRAGVPQTLLEVLLRTVEHMAVHLGQIIYIGKARLGADFETLSIPRGRP